MPETLSVQCCIAGGGPAGVMLGLLLARAGVPVLVLEKHEDFLRDFRGDTLHPSTLEIMHELGLLERFLRLPHQKVTRINARFGDLEFTVADFFSSADPMPLRRLHAAVGLSQLSCERRESVPHLSGTHERGGHGPDRE